jgi:hypothetical protein
VLDTADVSTHLAHDRRITTTDRRPEWSSGVDISPVVLLALLRCADEFLQPYAHLLPPLHALPGAHAALEALTTSQEVALLGAWAAIYFRWCAII